MVYCATMIPAGHQLIITKDQSPSLFNETFQENLHSTEGAKSETIYNFIEGCEILKHKGDILSVLEVGFGTGLGFFTTLEFLRRNSPGKKLIFYSLEMDLNLAKWALKDFQYSHEDFGLLSKGQDFELKVFIGDANEVLPKLKIGPIDAIYQDPFSPKKNPTLWTFEWFSMLLNLAGPNCILSTYSSSTLIKKSLLKAGWAVFERQGFGKKRTSTIAKTFGETPQNLKDKLIRSDIS
jgi:tRNA U34 5-methylaminomethyl-2-thiouridine-forming methyltransferase MnmC